MKYNDSVMRVPPGSTAPKTTTRYDLEIEKARKIIQRILESPEYLRNLTRRAHAGVLAPAIEAMLWHYLYGKPRDEVHVVVEESMEDLTRLSRQELADRAIALSKKALEIPDVEEGERMN